MSGSSAEVAQPAARNLLFSSNRTTVRATATSIEGREETSACDQDTSDNAALGHFGNWSAVTPVCQIAEEDRACARSFIFCSTGAALHRCSSCACGTTPRPDPPPQARGEGLYAVCPPLSELLPCRNDSEGGTIHSHDAP